MVVSCLIDTDECVADNNSSRLQERTAAEKKEIKHVWKGKQSKASSVDREEEVNMTYLKPKSTQCFSVAYLYLSY